MKIFANIALLVMFIGQGCGLRKQPTTDVNTREVVKEIYRDTTIRIESSVVTNVIDSSAIASIVNQIKAGKDTVIYRNTNTVLKFYKNEAGQLSVDCETERQAFTIALKEISKELSEKRTKTITEYKIPWYVRLSMVFLTVSNIILILKLTFKNG